MASSIIWSRLSHRSTTLASTSTALAARYADVWAFEVVDIVAFVDDDYSSYYGSMSVPNVLYYVASGADNVELIALNDTGTVDCTNNYWGIFPDVQSRMTLTRAASVDFTGFQISAVSGTGPQ